MFSKLIGLASVGSSLANIAILQRFLEGVVGIIALTIVSAMMAGMLIITSLYGAFYGLRSTGIGTGLALLIVAGIACLLMALLISFTIRKLREIRHLSSSSGAHGLDPVARVTALIHAFIQGFMGWRERH